MRGLGPPSLLPGLTCGDSRLQLASREVAGTRWGHEGTLSARGERSSAYKQGRGDHQLPGKWRDPGGAGWQVERFDDEDAAKAFKAAVEESGNNWPPGWAASSTNSTSTTTAASGTEWTRRTGASRGCVRTTRNRTVHPPRRRRAGLRGLPRLDGDDVAEGHPPRAVRGGGDAVDVPDERAVLEAGRHQLEPVHLESAVEPGAECLDGEERVTDVRRHVVDLGVHGGEFGDDVRSGLAGLAGQAREGEGGRRAARHTGGLLGQAM